MRRQAPTQPLFLASSKGAERTLIPKIDLFTFLVRIVGLACPSTYGDQPTSYYVYAEGAYEGSALRVYVSLGMTAPVDVRYTLQLSGSAAVMGRIPASQFSLTIPAWQSWVDLYVAERTVFAEMNRYSTK